MAFTAYFWLNCATEVFPSKLSSAILYFNSALQRRRLFPLVPTITITDSHSIRPDGSQRTLTDLVTFAVSMN